MSKSVGRGTDNVLSQWEQVNERKEATKEIKRFLSANLNRKKSARKKSKKKGRK